MDGFWATILGVASTGAGLKILEIILSKLTSRGKERDDHTVRLTEVHNKAQADFLDDLQDQIDRQDRQIITLDEQTGKFRSRNDLLSEENMQLRIKLYQLQARLDEQDAEFARIAKRVYYRPQAPGDKPNE